MSREARPRPGAHSSLVGTIGMRGERANISWRARGRGNGVRMMREGRVDMAATMVVSLLGRRVTADPDGCANVIL
jgi:hypothetical protein